MVAFTHFSFSHLSFLEHIQGDFCSLHYETSLIKTTNDLPLLNTVVNSESNLNCQYYLTQVLTPSFLQCFLPF